MDNEHNDDLLLEPNIKKKSKKYAYSMAVMAFLIALTFYVIFTKYDISKLFKIIKSGDVYYRYLILGLALTVVYLFTSGIAFKIILWVLKIPVSLYRSFVYASVDYYFCAVTPSASGGEPILMYYMRKDGISYPNAGLTILTYTAVYKFVLLFLSIFALIFYHHLIFCKTLILVLFIIGFIVNTFVVAFCLLATFRRNIIDKFGMVLIKLLARIKIIRNYEASCKTFSGKMDEYERSGKFIKEKFSSILLSIIVVVVQRVAIFSVAYLVYLAFKDGTVTKGTTYAELMAIQVILAVSVDSLPFPGGVGISEILLMTLFGFVYVGEHEIAIAMLLTRAISFYFPLLVTAIISLINHYKVTSKYRKKRTIDDRNI